MPRAALTQQEIDDVRSRALSSALMLFEEGGLPALALRGVATQLGVSPMTLYRYFPGGQPEIVAALRADGFRRFGTILQEEADRHEQALAGLISMSLAVASFAMEHSAVYRLMFDVSQPELETPESVLGHLRRRAWAPVTDVVSRALECGDLIGSVDVIPHLLFAGIHGVIQFEISRQPDPRRRISQLLVPMIAAILSHSGAPDRELQRLLKPEGAPSRRRSK